jgi:hypothetical protein
MAFPEATQLFPSVIQHTCPKEKVIPWGKTTHLLKEEHFFEEHNKFFFWSDCLSFSDEIHPFRIIEMVKGFEHMISHLIWKCSYHV